MIFNNLFSNILGLIITVTMSVMFKDVIGSDTLIATLMEEILSLKEQI